MQDLVDLVRCKGRLLQDEGKDLEAVELYLDLGLFSRDCEHNCYSPVWWGRTGLLYEDATEGFYELIKSGNTSKEGLRRMDTGLEALDQICERKELDWLNLRIWIGNEVMRGHWDDYRAPHPPVVSWRFGYSKRLMAVCAFESISRWYERRAHSTPSTWFEDVELGYRIDREAAESPNPMVHGFHIGWSSGTRFNRARIRLLRMAAHFLWSGEIVPLDDPFGTKLLHSEAGGTLRFWSVSHNGKDDSPKGRWKWGPTPGETSWPEDMVLEFSR